MSQEASSVEKGFVVLESLPIFKAIKAAKKSEKVIDSSKDVIKTTKRIGCNCFTAGTQVLTEEGEKPVQEIEVGDKVLAKDDVTGELAYKEVEWLFQRDVEETYNITVGGEVITTTDEHPFWIVGKGWVQSKNLVVGDVLTTSDRKELAIEKIEVKKEHKTVYNFKVKDFHTYFVSNLGIWTHNRCWDVDPSELTMSKIAEKHFYELTNDGKSSRPYVNSNGTTLLLKEIMDSRDPIKDPGGLKNGWRWDVEGTFGGKTGTWELVIDVDKNTVVHFLFNSRKKK